MTDNAPTIYSRLIKAQADFRHIAQDNKAAAFKGGSYVYANISDCLRVIRPILNKHGLAVLQRTTSDQNKVGIETVLVSEDGQTLESGIFFVPTEGLMQKGVQAFGSAVTYARRYSLISFLGLAYGEDDDDGAAATEHHYVTTTTKHQAKQPTPAHEDADWHHALTPEEIQTLEGVAVEGYEVFVEYMKANPQVAGKLNKPQKAGLVSYVKNLEKEL